MLILPHGLTAAGNFSLTTSALLQQGALSLTHASHAGAGSPRLHRLDGAADPLGGCTPQGGDGAISVQSWVRGGLLGAGGFGQVYLAFDKDKHGLFAVKQVRTLFLPCIGPVSRDALALLASCTVNHADCRYLPFS